MTTALGLAYEKFVADARMVLSVAGSTSELSVMGKLDAFLEEALVESTASTVNVIQQTGVADIGVPDFRINGGNELLGWIEFKAVLDKNLDDLKGHDKKQTERYIAGLHNLIVTNGWQWDLYQDGRRIKRVVFDRALFSSDTLLPADATTVAALQQLIGLFVTFKLSPYWTIEGAVSSLALRAKALKLGLLEVGQANAGKHLNQLRKDFDALLYRNGQPFTWERFVDSYVQIAAFGVLLWRLESDHEIGLEYQVGLKPGLHPLLEQCLSILWSPQSQVPIMKPLLQELCRTVNLIPQKLFTATPANIADGQYVPDPIVHAYEPFFSKYDRAAREANGVYYTPVGIVRQMVSGVNALLKSSLGREAGILDDSARFLDPATGTGTYLLGLANEVAREAEKAGLPTDQVVHEVLTSRVSAFELFPGPYAIAHQRLEALLAALGTPATARLPIYLADTLAAPETNQLPMSGFGPAGDEILAERERADAVKTGDDLLVIIGNPPYERLRTENGGLDTFAARLMQQVTDATPVERRADLKSATDLYVGFWAWALWALRSPADRMATLDSPIIATATNHGIATFISNRTWIIGPSLVGLRRLVREGVKEVWVFDLGGDARGGTGARSFADGDTNVFSIQTGVAIVWLVFDREYTGEPTIMYRRQFGNRATKLKSLSKGFDPNSFERVDSNDMFVPVRWPPALRDAPALPDLFRFAPFTGVQSARDKSPYSPWGVDADAVFAETRVTPRARPVRHGTLGTWADLSPAKRREMWATADSTRRNRTPPEPESLDAKKIRRALYRPMDVRSLYDDPSWIDWFREDLHAVYENGDVPTIVSLPRDFGAGPLAVHTSLLSEQHAFKGQAGGKGVFPLWLDGADTTDNSAAVVEGRLCGLSDEVLEWALDTFADSDDPRLSAYDYILAVLSAPVYSYRYWRELEAEAPRVPLTTDSALAKTLSALGARCRAAWDRDVLPSGLRWGGAGSGPLGAARFADETVQFANGRTVAGVSLAAWNFSVSHYRVLPNWLAARTHWTATIAQAQEVLKVMAAVESLAALHDELDSGFESLVGVG